MRKCFGEYDRFALDCDPEHCLDTEGCAQKWLEKIGDYQYEGESKRPLITLKRVE